MRIFRDLPGDLRYGARSLRRSPGLAATVVLSLALGIGGASAIFGLVNAVLLRPLGVRDPSRLVLLADGNSSAVLTPLLVDNGRLALYSYPLYRRLRDGLGGLEGLAAQDSQLKRAVVSRGNGPAEMAIGRLVSGNYFSVVGVGAALGRTFGPGDETAAGNDAVLVLSHRMWQGRFGGDPAVIGARLTVNGTPYTVVGVAPPDFRGVSLGDPSDFWAPVTMLPQLRRSESFLDGANTGWLHLVGRLAPGATMVGVEARANALFRQFEADNPALSSHGKTRIVVEPGGHGLGGLRTEMQGPLLVIMAGVALLFLIVCLNVSHLLLARAVQRQREMSIRTALGATRARLVRQLLAEGLLLAAMGTIGALLLRGWLGAGVQALAGLSLLEVPADGRVFAFTATVAVATAALLGLVPGWQASRRNLQESLRGTAAGPRQLASRALLVSQVAVSLVLLVGSGLLSTSLRRLRDRDKGFDEEHVLMVSIHPRLASFAEERAQQLYDDLRARVAALPGVRGASLSFPPLLGGQNVDDITVPGRRPKEVAVGFVTAGYFETVGMSVLRGRPFDRTDRRGSPGVAIVNEQLARALMDGPEAALHRQVRLGSSHPEPLEVVGIVADAQTTGLRRQPRPMVFLPVAQRFEFLSSLEVRAVGDPALLADEVRATVRAAYPDLPMGGARTLRTEVHQALRQERLLAALSMGFGLAALFLVCIGLYGVVARWAAQRTREIGVRMALGATGGGVRRMVLRQSFATVLGGVLIGLPAALAGSRLIESLLYGVTPADPATLAGAVLVLFTVAVVAAYLPARRASRIDPMTALRAE